MFRQAIGFMRAPCTLNFVNFTGFTSPVGGDGSCSGPTLGQMTLKLAA